MYRRRRCRHARDPVASASPRRRLAVADAALELTTGELLTRCLGMLAEPYSQGSLGALTRTTRWMAIGATMAAAGFCRSRSVSALAGATYLAGSAVSRFGILEVGQASAKDPKYVVITAARAWRRGALAASRQRG